MKQARLSIRLEPKIHQKLKRISFEESRSMHSTVNRLILLMIAQYERKHGEILLDE